MTTYIALFRAINVAGKRPLPMPALCTLMERIGLWDVQSYIQSGNVVFRSERPVSELESGIAEAVLREHGFRPQLLLLDAQRFSVMVKNNPFDSANGKALHLFFLFAPADAADLQRLDDYKSESERFQLIEQVFYLYAPDGIGRSRLIAQIEKALGVVVSGRNWNTVSRIQAMLEQVS